jgi:hypothetical protein
MLQDLLGRRLFVHFDEMEELPSKLKVPCESRGDLDLTSEFQAAAGKTGSFLFYRYSRWKSILDLATSWEEKVMQVVTKITNSAHEKKSVSRVFDFLKGSIVGGEEIVSADVFLQLMKKKVMAKNQKVVWRETLDALPDGCVHVRASPLSRMPDGLTVLPRSSPEISRSIIGWEMKNYSKSKFSVGQLQEAADKFGDLLRDAGDASGVLVIVLNGRCCMNLETFRGHLVTEADGIPGLKLNNEKMEVIVLAVSDVDEIFGGSHFRDSLSARGE